MDLGGSQSKIKCLFPVKCRNFQVISLAKLSSLTLISTELPLIFSSESRPFCQEAEVLTKNCFRFQPSSVKCQNFQLISLGKLSSFKLISTELPFILSARSGPFWQEVEALRVLLPLQALKCKISQFFGDFTRQTYFIYIYFKRASLNIFCQQPTLLAGSRCASKVVLLLSALRLRIGTLFPEKLGENLKFFYTSSENLNYL